MFRSLAGKTGTYSLLIVACVTVFAFLWLVVVAIETNQNARDIKVVKVTQDAEARAQAVVNARNIAELRKLTLRIAQQEKIDRQLINELRGLHQSHPELFRSPSHSVTSTATPTKHRTPTGAHHAPRPKPHEHSTPAHLASAPSQALVNTCLGALKLTEVCI